MNVSKDIKKQEAIKRMRMLGLFKPCIKAFENRNEVQMSEFTGALYEFSSNKELSNKVKEFEEEYNAIVHHVIHSVTEFGELYSFLYVSDHEDEWESDRLDIAYNIVMSYVWNKTDDYCSEFGSIGVKQQFGSLIRTQ